jgi:hypothetical protein
MFSCVICSIIESSWVPNQLLGVSVPEVAVNLGCSLETFYHTTVQLHCLVKHLQFQPLSERHPHSSISFMVVRYLSS